MPSLNSVAAARGPVLVIDSASTTAQVGLIRPGSGAIWIRSAREAGIAIFEGVAAVLAEAEIRRRDVGAMVFCEGPGSILGIRTAAMALRIWRSETAPAAPTFAYLGLQLAAHHLADSGTPEPFAVIADARRAAWHGVEFAHGAAGPLRRWSAAEVAEYPGALHVPTGLRMWSEPPRPAAPFPYAPAEWWASHGDTDLLHEASDPDAFLLHSAEYVPWTPRVHGAAVHPAR